MTTRDSNKLLNDAIIAMAHSFLQYTSEASPWIQTGEEGVEQQVRVLAARQRQDVADLTALLISREYPVDFGTFPTQYTDMQFLSLEKQMGMLTTSHNHVCDDLRDIITGVRGTGDEEAAMLLTAALAHEDDIARSLQEVAQELQAV